jgi:hypothetical protein
MVAEVSQDRCNKAVSFLNKKSGGTEDEKQEYLIFIQYIELRSSSAVSAFFGVHEYYVKRIVKKVRDELAKIVRNSN